MQPRVFLHSTFVGAMCWLTLFVGIFATPKANVHTLPEFPVHVGDQSPPERWCNWASVTDLKVYCQGDIGDYGGFWVRSISTNQVVTITYNMKRGKLAIGDLILAWGRPTAQTRSGNLRRVWWETRSAMIYAQPFTPQSPVWFISFNTTDSDATAWRGFTH